MQRLNKTHLVGWIGIICGVVLVLGGIATQVHAVSWGYPPDSSLGECLAKTRWYDLELFPDRDTAYAAMMADYNPATTICNGSPPLPTWCNDKPYWVEWNCRPNLAQCCKPGNGCPCMGCIGVTDSGFSCVNCKKHYPVNGIYYQSNYWYPYCFSSPTCYPPTQQPDPPITTPATDKNNGTPLTCGGSE